MDYLLVVPPRPRFVYTLRVHRPCVELGGAAQFCCVRASLVPSLLVRACEYDGILSSRRVRFWQLP